MKAVGTLALFLLCACGANVPPEVELAGNTMGTQFSVKLIAGDIDVDAVLLQQEIEGSLAHVEHMMSTYLSDSEISRFNASTSTKWQTVSREFCFSVVQAQAVSILTDGSFDITVGPLVDLWGFGPGDIIDEPPAEENIAAMLKSVGYKHLHADCAQPALRKDIADLALDMSAFGKGYATDRLATILDETGVENYLVEVGGELQLRGHNVEDAKWAIGIEAPLPNQRRPHMVLHLSDTAVATSGDYRNYFEVNGKHYSHTIDTRTGRPVTHTLASVTVVDEDGFRADALATALLVMGPDAGMALATREGMAVLFLLRTENGIEELSTPAFEQLRSIG